jgi:hypothetical protein
MGKYRTAMGRELDMASLMSRNEKVRAVGNQKVNARGDTIDGNNSVVVSATDKVGSQYQKTVTNRSANVVRNRAPSVKPADVPNSAKPVEKSIEKVLEQLSKFTKEELELLDNDDDIEVENIKAKETKKTNGSQTSK